MLYHTGDSWRTQNIQINKVIAENEECVFHCTEKAKWTFGQPNILQFYKTHFVIENILVYTAYPNDKIIKTFILPCKNLLPL